ncbi:MAG: PQQ-binding-like beta-propeller repeat protein [Prevotellaceae bacterium]|jgi:outer membrane protein assembly factor BamB|nr:PQQ-binding-like beta-propeller repeat protein [Prevotellaceae bacterium]
MKRMLAAMPNMLSSLFLALFLALLSGCALSSEERRASESWPLFRGEAALSGYSDLKLPDSPALKWTYRSDARTASSPAVYAGTAYWCDKRGKIRGVDREGVLVFEFDMETAVEASPLIRDSVLYIGRIDGRMAAVSLAARDTLWTFETMGQISASPNLAGEGEGLALVFGSYDNFLYCVDLRSGKELSRHETGYYINGAPAVRGNEIVFGGCDSWLRVIDLRTGRASDSLRLDAYVPASPAIRDNCCYVADYSGNVYEALLRDGKIAKHGKIATGDAETGAFVSIPAVSDRMLYLLSNDRYLRAIRRADGSLAWKYLTKGNTTESSPLVCRDRVIACTAAGIVTILDADTGEALWEFDAGERITASPAVVGDRFYILGSKGTLFCFG